MHEQCIWKYGCYNMFIQDILKTSEILREYSQISAYTNCRKHNYWNSGLWIAGVLILVWVCYIVTSWSIYDEYSIDNLDMPEGSYFPRFCLVSKYFMIVIWCLWTLMKFHKFLIQLAIVPRKDRAHLVHPLLWSTALLKVHQIHFQRLIWSHLRYLFYIFPFCLSWMRFCYLFSYTSDFWIHAYFS